jgi:hypothetical protein
MASKPDSSPYDIIDLALDCGMLNAAIGFNKNSSDDEFQEQLDEVIESGESNGRFALMATLHTFW